ncbi:hypothetical protein Esi_0037_0106 [Ectocarpus siliculosus]|uniref:Uncharacterized protein n=1 Tax=Ectocarpus siliculosus TaxID=2880 RepID=D8LLQ1_ECTSI|nr:hypothetical protein Esi_0037_0106 [Ectocarpus siliculosus]|eukprot:CBN74682.1 hypothetical protein Esi_0037_0106 [Ectocarpus siliculosus]
MDNKDGIFHVDGILGFLAEYPDFEAPDDATPEDLHGMARLARDGIVLAHGDEAMYYTDSAVFVVVEPSTDKNDNSNSNSEAAGGSQGHSAGLAQEQLQRELEASGLDLSCNELRFERTPVEGMSGVLLLDDDVMCKEKRILEVGHHVIVVSDKPDLRLKGVHFVVQEKASLTFIVATMVLEKLEGESGELFTVEPQGVLAMSADKWSPSPDNGTEEDVHSLVALKKGGRFELDGKASFTGSTMTISMRNKSEEEKKNNKNKNHKNENDRGACQSTVQHPSTGTDENLKAAAPGNADADVIDVTSDGGHAHTNAISTKPGFSLHLDKEDMLRR